MTEWRVDQAQSENLLRSEQGSTTIQDAVVANIGAVAAQEVDGIRMGSGASQAVGGLLGSITGSSGGSWTTGVSVEVGQDEATLDLTLTAEYGKPIPQLSEAVRHNVINQVQRLTGLKVNEVNIEITDVYFPTSEDEVRRVLMAMQMPDMYQLVNLAADPFEFEVTPEARQVLIEQGERQGEHVAMELAEGRVTHDYLVDTIRTVLSNAQDVAKERGQYYIDGESVRESMARECPYFPWC